MTSQVVDRRTGRHGSTIGCMTADLRTTLSVLRSAVGVGAWVAPGLGGRLFGLGDGWRGARPRSPP